MKFKVKKSALDEFFNISSKITQKFDIDGTSDSVMFIIRDGILSLRSTDIIHFVEMKNIDIDGDVENIEFSCNPFYLRNAIAHSKTDTITFTLSGEDIKRGNGKLKVFSGSRTTLLLKSVFTMPDFPDVSDIEYDEFNVSELNEYLKSMKVFTEANKIDPANVYAGVCFGKDYIVASNRVSAILAKNNTSINDGTTIFPSLHRVIEPLNNCSIGSNDLFLSIKSSTDNGDIFVHIVKVAVPYPYSKIVDEIQRQKTIDSIKITLDKQSLDDIINRISPFASPEYDKINFYYKDGFLNYKIDNIDGYRYADKVDCICDVDEFKFGINLKILSCIDMSFDDVITFEFKEGQNIVIIQDNTKEIASYYHGE